MHQSAAECAEDERLGRAALAGEADGLAYVRRLEAGTRSSGRMYAHKRRLLKWAWSCKARLDADGDDADPAAQHSVEFGEGEGYHDFQHAVHEVDGEAEEEADPEEDATELFVGWVSIDLPTRIAAAEAAKARVLFGSSLPTVGPLVMGLGSDGEWRVLTGHSELEPGGLERPHGWSSEALSAWSALSWLQVAPI